MRILTALTYYRPYTSGLTIYAQRLAQALVERGHEVTVLAMQHEPAQRREEVKGGVHVFRVPVMARVSKGFLSPAFALKAAHLLRHSDLLHLHLPQFDAGIVALAARLRRVPILVTYHCDLNMPPGWLSKTAETIIHLSDRIAGALADRVIGYTQDYADHSTYLRRFCSKLSIIPPPVALPPIRPDGVQRFRDKHVPPGKGPLIAMAARFASEKGVEVLLDAFPRILTAHPDALIVFAGEYRDVPGEAPYLARLRPRIEELGAAGRWRFLGVLDTEEMAALYGNIDLLVVPSLNSTESFGLVQIEAMMNGVPVVASDLPGIRYPARTTGLGGTFPAGDARALAEVALDVLARFPAPRGQRPDIAAAYEPLRIATRYEAELRAIRRL